MRRHSLTLFLLALGLVWFGLYTWGEWGYFCDQARDHGSSCGGFFDREHLHDYVYNAASNWQSEVLMGTVLVLIAKAGGFRERDAGE